MVDHYDFRGEKRLLYLPQENADHGEEFDYFRKNGITRAQDEERDRALRCEEIEGSAVTDLAGEPPTDICDVRGFSPQRARYVRYSAWRQQIMRELKELEAKKAELEGMIASLAPAKAERWAGIRRTADALLGRDGGGQVDAKVLADRVAVAEHRAKAAEVALKDLESDLDRARLRLKRLEEREAEFLHPALIELADEAGLGTDYLKAINNLRSVAGLIFGLIEVVHSYGGGFERPQGPITFPRINMPSVAATHGDFVINNHGVRDMWERFADALRQDARQSLPAIKPAAPPGGYAAWPWGK